MRYWFLSLALLCASALADEVTLFTLKHLPPQSLISQIKPLVGDGSVSAYGDKLIVRATADRLQEIRWLVEQLDKAPRNLLIEVEVGAHRSGHDRGLSAQGSWQSGGPQGELRFRHHGTRGHADNLQSIRTLEGRAALISTGQSVPIYEVEQSQSADGSTRQSFRQHFRETQTGFYALPRIQGEQVTIEIYQQDERPGIRTGHFNTQQASTIVSGKLGNWINLGGIDEQQRRRGSGLGFSARTTRAEQRNIALRVTVIEP